MPCYHSITGWQAPSGGPLTFGDRPPRPSWTRLQVPCGQCIGCRLEHSRQWAIRCVLEARSHDQNSFITLTYSDEHLPSDLSLDPQHLRKFLHRLRKRKGPFRYYACGEYGEQTKRAHYHACLFGMDFQDKIQLRRINEYTLYTSEELNNLWGYGHTSIGELTFESAAYCARYVLKKKLGEGDLQHVLLDEQTGELKPVYQPFARMSLGGGRKAGRPGAGAIGKAWLTKNHNDIYSHDKDFLVMRNQKMKPPKYFDRIYDTINPERLARIKTKRKEERENQTLEELRAHEAITRARIIQRKQV